MSEDLNLENSASTPETSGTDASNFTNTTTEAQPAIDSNTGKPIDIDAPDRYRYQGRSIKEWESGYMRQQDYTSKTQAIAQERKYIDNLAVDLDRVRSNPTLAEQFRSIYPEKYHAYLRYVLSENSANNPQSQSSYQQQQRQFAQLDPGVEMRINNLERTIRDKEVAAISAELDNKFRTLSEKYPFADEEAVIARAQALLNKMKEMNPGNPDIRISDKQWDALWKSQHERSYGLSDARYKKQVQSQINASKKGSDMGQGGGIPGQSPRQFKTIKEATSQALADIEAGTF